MNKIRLASIAFSIFALFAVSACEKKTDETVDTPEAVSTEAASSEAASSEASSSEESSSEASSTDAVADMNMPESCKAYFTKVEACVSKLGANGAAFKQGMDAAREQWKAITDMGALDEACKQVDKSFEETAKQMGC
jgi:hypothetical protein